MTTTAFRSTATATQVEINVTPLIDVLLALVVIMMVTAPIAMHRLALPIGSDGTPPPSRILTVSVKETGELYLDGVAINRGQLAANFAAAAQGDPPATLDIRSEANTRYDDIATVLAIAQSSGMSAIRVEGARADE